MSFSVFFFLFLSEKVGKGRKSIQDTLVYTQMVQFKKEDASAIATTIEYAHKVVEAEFEYITENTHNLDEAQRILR